MITENYELYRLSNIFNKENSLKESNLLNFNHSSKNRERIDSIPLKKDEEDTNCKDSIILRINNQKMIKQILNLKNKIIRSPLHPLICDFSHNYLETIICKNII